MVEDCTELFSHKFEHSPLFSSTPPNIKINNNYNNIIRLLNFTSDCIMYDCSVLVHLMLSYTLGRY